MRGPRHRNQCRLVKQVWHGVRVPRLQADSGQKRRLGLADLGQRHCTGQMRGGRIFNNVMEFYAHCLYTAVSGSSDGGFFLLLGVTTAAGPERGLAEPTRHGGGALRQYRVLATLVHRPAAVGSAG